jgi:hypothetical protein
MNMIDEAAALLRVLSADLGVELEFNASGACGLRIDDALDITLRHELSPPGLLAYASVGALPKGPVEWPLRSLLEANHLWDRTRGSTWSLAGDEVILSRFLPLPGLEAAALSTALADFVEVALAGQRALQPTGASGASGARWDGAGISAAPSGGLPPGAIAP